MEHYDADWETKKLNNEAVFILHFMYLEKSELWSKVYFFFNAIFVYDWISYILLFIII